MDMLPCLPPSYGHSPDWFVASSFIKDLSTYEQTLEATSTAYYWISLGRRTYQVDLNLIPRIETRDKPKDELNPIFKKA